MRLRDRKNKMGKALIDMSGNEPEPEKLQDGHATYTISDELIAKVKAELETVKDAMTRVAPTCSVMLSSAIIELMVVAVFVVHIGAVLQVCDVHGNKCLLLGRRELSRH